MAGAHNITAARASASVAPAKGKKRTSDANLFDGEAESRLVGACLSFNAMVQHCGNLSAEQFGQTIFQTCWRAIQEWTRASIPFDDEMLVHKLRDQHVTVERSAVLEWMINAEPVTPERCRNRAAAIIRLAWRRQLARNLERAHTEVYDPAISEITIAEHMVAYARVVLDQAADAELVSETVDGMWLLGDLEGYYRKYSKLPEEAYCILALWVLHCHAFAAFSRTPYIQLSSPAPECGKTTVLEITELVVPRPWLTMSLSNAVLARVIEANRPVLLLDEVDQLLSGDRELIAAVMQTVNSGYKKSGRRTILVQGKNKDWEPKDLSTFCAKMLSGITDLPAATRSRCIPIMMERMSRDDVVTQIDEYIIEPEANSLFVQARDWAKAHLKELRDIRPEAPPQLGHRQREVCRPLLAIADAVGGDWPQRLRGALVRILTTATEPADVRILALAHLRDVLEAHPEGIHEVRDGQVVSSADLCTWLVEIEDGPWANWGRSGKPITQNQLARQIRGFSSPGPVRIGDRTCKGYRIASLKNAFDRYLTPSPDSNRLTETNDENKRLIHDFEPPQNMNCVALKSDLRATESTNVSEFRLQDREEAGGRQEPIAATKRTESMDL